MYKSSEIIVDIASYPDKLLGIKKAKTVGGIAVFGGLGLADQGVYTFQAFIAAYESSNNQSVTIKNYYINCMFDSRIVIDI